MTEQAEKYKKLKIAIFFGLAVLLPNNLLFAQSTDVPCYTSTKNDADAERIYASVKKPKTIMSLLENIKIIIDHNLMSREDFYTEANINQLIGYTKISCAPTANLKKFCEDDRQYEALKINRFLEYTNERNLNHYLAFSIQNELPSSGEIYIYNIERGIDIHDVIAVFGDQFEVYHEDILTSLPEVPPGQPIPDITMAGRFLYRKSVEEPLILARKQPNGTTIAYGFDNLDASRGILNFFVSPNGKIRGILCSARNINI